MFSHFTLPARAVFSVVVLFSSFAPHARAQDFRPEQGIFVLPTTALGAPSASDIVTYYYTSPDKRSSTPPLQGLAVGNPAIATYLLPLRAQGDLLARLTAQPNTARAKLERYVVIWYPAGTDRSVPLAALQADPYVAAAYVVPDGEFSGVSLTEFGVIGSGPPLPPAGLGQYGRDDMNVEAAWNVAGGYALIQVIDSGLYENHPALRQFQGTNYVGGNFVPVASMDISTTVDAEHPIVSAASIDERRAMSVKASCNPNPSQPIRPNTAGHGTHTAGLIAANGEADLGVAGTCRHCGIAMWKTAYVECGAPFGEPMQPILAPNSKAWAAALGLSGDIGAQVVNMSFGFADVMPHSYPCTNSIAADTPMCLAIASAADRDVALVASSGNNRNRLNFPASDPHVVAAGGYQPDGALWDEMPSGDEADCPLSAYGLGRSECGSNYTMTPLGAPQELVASAKTVLSTTYPQYNWSPAIRCGDQFQFSGTSWGGGAGLCTGTSMSAPQVAGLLGLIRSINPLAPFGDAPTTQGTLRHVLASTASRAQAGLGWEAELGYGIPDALAAARKMLGKIARAPVRNRATPLFRLRSAAANGGVGDYADTTSPQAALAMMLNAVNAWVPSGPPTAAVPNYPQFPHGPDEGPAANAAPRAPVYVLSTDVRPRNEWPALVPLYLMSRGGEAGHIDFMLVTTEADIETAHNQPGYLYQLHTIQGYIYAPCAPEPGCVPPGALPFYRGCTASGDCAAFLSTEAGNFSSYTRKFPWSAAGTRALLGYAYPAGNGDTDGLPNAFEYVVGTDPAFHDSDRDGINDSTEMPLIGVPTGDPCFGGTGSLHCGADVIFRNGFDAG